MTIGLDAGFTTGTGIDMAYTFLGLHGSFLGIGSIVDTPSGGAGGIYPFLQGGGVGISGYCSLGFNSAGAEFFGDNLDCSFADLALPRFSPLGDYLLLLGVLLANFLDAVSFI